MNIKRTLLNTALVLVTAATLAACGQDAEGDKKVEDAMSNTGDVIEQTMDDAGQALNNAGNAIEDTMTDTGNAIEDTMTDSGHAIEDACEEAKEGVSAKDTDC